MRSQLLSEALGAREQERLDEWWAGLSDEDREAWRQMIENLISAAGQMAEAFRKWLREPLIDLVAICADWYESLPDDVRAVMEAVSDEQEG